MGIKFGQGVAAKTAYAVIVLLVVWLAIIWKLSDSLTLDAFLVGGGIVATLVTIWWIGGTQRFAERNPDLALLDGAQFIEYRRWEAEAKGGLRGDGRLIAEDAPVLIDRSRGK